MVMLQHARHVEILDEDDRRGFRQSSCDLLHRVPPLARHLPVRPREQFDGLLTPIAAFLPTSHVALEAPQICLRLALTVGVVDHGAIRQCGEVRQPQVAVRLLAGWLLRQYCQLGAGETDIPAVTFTRDGDGLGVPSNGRDRRRAMRPILERTGKPLSRRAPSWNCGQVRLL